MEALVPRKESADRSCGKWWHLQWPGVGGGGVPEPSSGSHTLLRANARGKMKNELSFFRFLQAKISM